METCPPEIHALIFTFACTDDGTTGRSLSLVSRYIRQVSAPYQWQCLSISGAKQARGFSAQVTALRRTSLLRPIYHLFLSSRNATDAVDGWPLFPSEEWAPFQQAILRFAAPTLCTLTFVCLDPPLNSAAYIVDVFHVPLPQLTELTIRGRCTPLGMWLQKSSPDLSEPEDESAESPCMRPNLRRLHLACAYHGLVYGTKAEHDLIRTLSPCLTHLRLSILDMWGSKRIAEVIHAECAERGIVRASLNLAPLQRLSDLPRSRQAKEVTWDRILPDTLELFVIQPPPTALTDFYCSCCMELRGDVDVMRTFEAMARDADERFLYLPTRRRMGYGYEEAKADWLDRIRDGPGCWTERKVPPGDDHVLGVSQRLIPGPSKSKKMSNLRKVVKKLQKVKFW